MGIISIQSVALGLIFAGSKGVSRGTSAIPDTDPTIKQRLYDSVHTDRATIEKGQRRVSFIFKKVGVNVDWMVVGEPQFRILIVEQMPPEIRPGGDLFGYTPKDPDGTSSGIAYVAFGSIKDFIEHPDAGRPRLDSADMLAYCIVHEIGHLLLPAGAHSPTGIMRPRWRATDFQLIATGRLLFTPVQAKLIRDAVARLAQTH